MEPRCPRRIHRIRCREVSARHRPRAIRIFRHTNNKSRMHWARLIATWCSGRGERITFRFFPKLDWQATSADHMTLVYNYSRFNSPGGEITFNPVATFGAEALPNNFVRDHHASVHRPASRFCTVTGADGHALGEGSGDPATP